MALQRVMYEFHAVILVLDANDYILNQEDAAAASAVYDRQ